MKYINLPTLVELKLASGMTNPGRLKDLSDVLELIKLLNLPAEFAEKLHPYVRGKFAELWGQGRKRFVTLWRNKWLTADAKSIEDMIASLKEAAELLYGPELKSALFGVGSPANHAVQPHGERRFLFWSVLEVMRRDGVVLEDDGGVGDDYAHLVTTDPAIAKKYDMVEESEFWVDAEDDGAESDGADPDSASG